MCPRVRVGQLIHNAHVDLKDVINELYRENTLRTNASTRHVGVVVPPCACLPIQILLQKMEVRQDHATSLNQHLVRGLQAEATRIELGASELMIIDEFPHPRIMLDVIQVRDLDHDKSSAISSPRSY